MEGAEAAMRTSTRGELRRLEGKFTAMLVCWLLGIGCLFSWNSMLTIQDYYVILFPKYHPMRILTLVYQPFALVALAILTYYEASMNTRKRNLIGYILFFFGTLAILILDFATSGKGGMGSFIGMCAISASFGVADAYVQGGMVCDLSFMLPELLQSFVAGLAASGAIASGLRLLTKGIFDDSQKGLRTGTLLFFALCTIIELLCVLLYAFVFPKLPIVKYYRSREASGEDEANSTQHERLSNRDLLWANIDYALDIFLIYLLTTSIFPGFLSEDTGAHSLGSWYALVLVAMFNVWDLVGRYIPLIARMKLESRKGLMIAVLVRFLLVPAFYFTAKYADQGWMIFLTSFLGLTNGYLVVCVLTSAPKGYMGPEQNALGNILMFFLMGGLFAGVTSGWLWLIGKGW